VDRLKSLGWLGPSIGVASLGLWAWRPEEMYLGVGFLACLVSFVAEPRNSRLRIVGILVVLAGVLAGTAAHREVARLTDDWDGYWEARKATVGELLREELDTLLSHGEAAADELAEVVWREGVPANSRSLARIRASYGIGSVTVYDGSGTPLVWDGEHRGKVPEPVQRGIRRYLYQDLPLFGYLYVTASTPDLGATAVAAILIRTDLPERVTGRGDDFASTFRRRAGEDVRFQAQPAPQGAVGWDLALGDGTLFSVVLQEPDPADRVADRWAWWRGMVAGLAFIAWILLTLGAPLRSVHGVPAAMVLLFLAAVVPLDVLGARASLFDLGTFRLPGPFPVSLGRLAALSVALVMTMGVLPRPRRGVPAWVGAAAVGLGFPLVLAWFRAGVGRGGIGAGEVEWIVYQACVGVLLTLMAGVAMAFTRDTTPVAKWHAGVAVGLTFALGAGSAAFTWDSASLPWAWTGLWAVPLMMVSRTLSAWDGWQRPLVGWVLAGTLASTAAIPSTWADRLQDRMVIGTGVLEGLARPDDPEVEEALFLASDIGSSKTVPLQDQVELLYEVWQESGLAGLGHPLWLTLWSPGGIPEEELRVGVDGAHPPVAGEDLLQVAVSGTSRVIRYNRVDARYVLQAPLQDRWLLTVVVPPFVLGGRASPLTPLLAEGATSAADVLDLVPLLPDDPHDDSGVTWRRAAGGWQGDLPLSYPNGAYHAHYHLEVPGFLLALSRATLLLGLNLLLFLPVWIGGRSLSREVVPPGYGLRGLVISFRARVTLALFGFFLLANAIFGTLAYRTIAGAAQRAARVLAERVVEDAADWYLEESGEMGPLARRVGTELMEYRRGELREGSVAELVELGLYEAWIPYPVHRLLDTGEEIRDFTLTEQGDWSYVTAFRRLPDGDVLGAQVPLQAGATAIRSRDVLELLGFGVLVGAMLSLGLALMVGRALTRPIRSLQVASERVGAGNLGLRLPSDRSDEFGLVFRAFNRMVSRLRRARRQLVRTTRRTQAIMEEAAVGMVALDPAGIVTLANPRAESILQSRVVVGESLLEAGPLGRQLAEWLARNLEDLDEADTELQWDARRYRVRARRVEVEGARGGIVVAVEDVTDELRTERVLAWGEMARQVAHEVKNPLTPIKLSIQHIRRAWSDGRPDFDDILVRNADAMLKEIDRLATIAQSFSRFGAPGQAGTEVLTAVDVQDVVDEVLALYSSGEAFITFAAKVEEPLPLVLARGDELKEVLVNVLENARAALAQGGSVEVCARRSDEGVVVEVVDDGTGIPEDVLTRVFEPHFSTRSKGTGLGLAIVKRLVESWGGTVDMDSRPGRGTTVTMTLLPWMDGGGLPEEDQTS